MQCYAGTMHTAMGLLQSNTHTFFSQLASARMTPPSSSLQGERFANASASNLRCGRQPPVSFHHPLVRTILTRIGEGVVVPSPIQTPRQSIHLTIQLEGPAECAIGRVLHLPSVTPYQVLPNPRRGAWWQILPGSALSHAVTLGWARVMLGVCGRSGHNSRRATRLPLLALALGLDRCSCGLLDALLQLLMELGSVALASGCRMVVHHLQIRWVKAVPDLLILEKVGVHFSGRPGPPPEQLGDGALIQLGQAVLQEAQHDIEELAIRGHLVYFIVLHVQGYS
jgi:hypothetical protein